MENEHLFRFPKTLPNDLEDFTLFYPLKFPPIIRMYNELVKQLHLNPVAFRNKCLELQKELIVGFQKIKDDYDNCTNRDLSFLVKIDQRLHKLFCYRFWIINYLFCDGPLHSYYVSKIRMFAEKLAQWDEIEDKEPAILEIERALLQSDYADLYFKNTFHSLSLHDYLIHIPAFQKDLQDLKLALPTEDNHLINPILDRILLQIEIHPDAAPVRELLVGPKLTGAIRGDNLMLYNMISHAFLFYEDSLKLKKRFLGSLLEVNFNIHCP